MRAEFVQYQTYRTDAYAVSRAESEEVSTYWGYETAVGWTQGRLVQVDIHPSCRITAPISETMPEKEALKKLAEIDAEARAKFAAVDTKAYEELRRLGDEYHRATPYQQHQVYIAGVRQEQLKAQAPKFRFKP